MRSGDIKHAKLRLRHSNRLNIHSPVVVLKRVINCVKGLSRVNIHSASYLLYLFAEEINTKDESLAGQAGLLAVVQRLKERDQDLECTKEFGNIYYL